jgi:membrane fusion protein (multidrug efflux system)
MWIYFYVPERDYLEYMAGDNEKKKNLKIELELANGEKFEHLCTNLVVEADFNNQNGTVGFRADFPNPERLLRHGQTGNVVISRVQTNAIVIPQRATFEVLQKRYVYVIDKDNVAHQREINVQNELEDLFVLKDGLGVDDKIVLEGIRQVRDGDAVECEERPAEQVASHLKYHAE